MDWLHFFLFCIAAFFGGLVSGLSGFAMALVVSGSHPKRMALLAIGGMSLILPTSIFGR